MWRVVVCDCSYPYYRICIQLFCTGCITTFTMCVICSLHVGYWVPLLYITHLVALGDRDEAGLYLIAVAVCKFLDWV